ncbi:hypothetical protein [Levilactobacillus huananensis]|uniref:hypothetical protein n=1 Tax=Levilactobacillus huananensis TaxID=2486019 RepID=UPI000F7AF523|nr:hypothetical protein [Levilactobacillus huananensis]
MSFLMLVIIVGGGAWFVHWKFGFSWGKIWGSIGVGAFMLVRWAFSQDHEHRQKIDARFKRLSQLTNEELKNYANDYTNSPEERSSALRMLNTRRENGTGPF